MTIEPHEMNAAELSAAFEIPRTLASSKSPNSVPGRIEALDSTINAFCHIDVPATETMAEASEKRWMDGESLSPLDGVPVAIKDLLLTKGWPTRRGSLTVDHKGPWNEDAPSVARLREAGAVLIAAKPRRRNSAGRGLDRQSAYRHHAQSVEHQKNAGRFFRRFGGSCGCPFRAARAWHRWGRLHSHSRKLHRDVRTEAELRPRAGLSAIAVWNGGPCRSDEPRCALQRDADEHHQQTRRARLGIRRLMNR